MIGRNVKASRGQRDCFQIALGYFEKEKGSRYTYKNGYKENIA